MASRPGDGRRMPGAGNAEGGGAVVVCRAGVLCRTAPGAGRADRRWYYSRGAARGAGSGSPTVISSSGTG